MKLGLQNLAPVVTVDMEELDLLMSDVATELNEIVVADAIAADVLSLIATVEQFGFTEALDSLYGAELRGAGIDTSVESDELVLLLEGAISSEEGFAEIAEAIKKAPAAMKARMLKPFTAIAGLKDKLVAFMVKRKATAKSAKLTAEWTGTTGKSAKIVAKLNGVKSTLAGAVRGRNGIIALAIIFSIATIAVLIKLLSNPTTKALLDGELEIPEEAKWNEEVVAKSGKFYKKDDTIAAVKGAIAVIDALGKLDGESLTMDALSGLGDKLPMLASEKMTVGEAGFDVAGMMDAHKAITAGTAAIAGVIDGISQISLSEDAEEADKGAVKAAIALAKQSISIITKVTAQHLNIIRKSKATVKANV